MKKIMFITFLAVILAACAPAATPAPTETPLSTFTPVPPTTAPTFDFALVPATPISTQPPFVPAITPDTIQVERWKEYQTELAKALFVYNPVFPQQRFDSDVYKGAICEWDILGRSNWEMYLWVACISADSLSLRTNPAVVFLEANGVIREIKTSLILGYEQNSQRAIYDLILFPMDVQEKLCVSYLGYFVAKCDDRKVQPGREDTLVTHLKYRQYHTNEPPLVVLSTIPTATPMP